MISELLSRRAKEGEGDPFLISDYGDYSFTQVWNLSRRLSSILAERIAPGEHVALVAGNSAAYVVAFLAINFAGGVAVCLNNALLGEAILYQIRQSDATLLLTDRAWEEGCTDDLRAKLEAVPRIVIEDEASFMALAQTGSLRNPVKRRPDDPFSILYTSGTTGLPKGVVCTEASYLASGRDMAELLALTPADRTMVFMPLFHTNPQVYGLMAALHAGSALVIRERFSATDFFGDARRFRATGFTFVGSVLAILASRYAGDIKDHSLRYCVGGGTDVALVTDVEARFGFTVHELYGMTEIGGWISGSKASEIRVGTNGQVRQDIAVRIADDFDNEVLAGVRGEILVRPKQPGLILSGYYKKPEQFVASTRNLWFHTGDIGSLGADGYLSFHGRRGDVIRRGGEMIPPDAIERMMLQAPGIIDCAIVGVPDPTMGMEIKAVIVASRAMTGKEIHAHLAPAFPKYMFPRYLEFVDHIPRTETAKIKRSELRDITEQVIDLSRHA
jgi:acyl-CoA synthetase (AMP-forming)/AMP-acid ligase II